MSTEEPPRTFISYSHDSEDHKARVLRLANRLRADGIDAIIDVYEPSPHEGWPQWMQREIRDAKYCLVIATETYRKRADGIENSGTGKGARWESLAITQELYEQEGGNSKFLAVLLKRSDADYIPSYLAPYTYFDTSSESGYEELLRFLSGQPRNPRPPIGPIRNLPPAPLLRADEATQDIELSVVAYASEEADDTTHMHRGFFYPWVPHAGHYELRVRPRVYKKDRVERMALRETLQQFHVDARIDCRFAMPFAEYDSCKNFLVGGSEGVEGTRINLAARAYEYVRLHRSGQFRVIRNMPDDYKDGRFEETDREISAYDLIVTVSLMWILAGLVASKELDHGEVADVLVRVDGLARRRMTFTAKEAGFIAKFSNTDNSHDGTKNEFVWTGALSADATVQDLLAQAAEQLGNIMWSFGLADASLTIKRAQRVAFGTELVPMSAAEEDHEFQMAEFYEKVAARSHDVGSEPMPLLTAEARMVGPDESRRLGLAESSATRLVVFITNAGRGPARDVSVLFEGFDEDPGDDYIGSVGVAAVIVRAYYCPRCSAGSVPAGSVPDVIKVRYDGIGWSNGIVTLQRVPSSHPPKWTIRTSAKADAS